MNMIYLKLLTGNSDLLQDFVMGPCGTKLSENVKSWLAKGFAVAYGLLSFGVVFIVKYLPGVLQVKNSPFVTAVIILYISNYF